MHLDTEEIQEALIHQRGVVLKPRLIVQYYLGGTLVALETSRLLTFLTAFHVIHIYQSGSKRGNVLYYAFLKRMICVRLHMEDGFVFRLALQTPRKEGWLSHGVLCLLDRMTMERAATSHGCTTPSRLGFESSYIARVHITPCLIMH